MGDIGKLFSGKKLTEVESEAVARSLFAPVKALAFAVGMFWVLVALGAVVQAANGSAPFHVTALKCVAAFGAEHPIKLVIVPLQILLGCFGGYLLYTKLPKSPNVVYPKGVSALGYYVTVNVFAFAIYMELLFPITSIAFDLPIVWDIIAILVVLLLVSSVFLWLCIVREKFKPQEYRGILIPVIMTATPGLSVLPKLSALKILPKIISDYVAIWFPKLASLMVF